MGIRNAQTVASIHLRVHNAMSEAPKPLKDLKMGPSSSLFRTPLEVTFNEDKEVTSITQGLCMCIGNAQTAASNHFRVHDVMF